MEFQKEVFSKVFSLKDYKARFDEIIHILEKHSCKEVEILFGVAWGNTYKDWTPFTVPLHQVAHEIELAEQSGEGWFGDEDFYIIIHEPEMVVLFCHEADIHLRYNEENSITTEILASWEAEHLINFVKAGND